jgi:hypothetical protein
MSATTNAKARGKAGSSDQTKQEEGQPKYSAGRGLESPQRRAYLAFLVMLGLTDKPLRDAIVREIEGRSRA